MSVISSGISDLDRLIDSLHVGDNVIWEIEAGTSPEFFIRKFIKQSVADGQTIIYISFNKSPQSILEQIGETPSEGFMLLDCFTAGKGKNDGTFQRFYKKNKNKNVVLLSRPSDISDFSNTLNSIEDNLPPGARYIFDSLTGMQDLWEDESRTYRFFTYMCPRLYDLGTVAYWILEKDAHSQGFKANLRHITQAVLELYKKKENLYIKAHKLDGRQSREAFKPHLYRVKGSDISIEFPKKDPLLDIGSKIRELRGDLGMSQKELADRVNLTPGYISQIENNQISPSLNSFIQICNALGTSPDEIWKRLKPKELPWLIKKERVFSQPLLRENGVNSFSICQNGTMSGAIFVIEPHSSVKKHVGPLKGKQIIHILKGNIYVTVGEHREKLIPGDSVFLKEGGEEPSMWENWEDIKAELLVINA